MYKENGILKNIFLNQIKVNNKNIDKVIKKRKFLEEIDGNREALNMLSVDRLKQLKRYYEEVIRKM